MENIDRVRHPDDIAYIRANYFTLEDLPGSPRPNASAPEPSYVLADGTAFFPADYFAHETNRERFRERYISESELLGLPDGAAVEQETWEAFLSGIYGVCLRQVTPENIARKTALLNQIEELTAHPQPRDPQWTCEL